MSPPRQFRLEVTAWAVLFVALSLTLLLWNHQRTETQRRAEARFGARVSEISSALQRRMRDYEQVLQGGVALFAASPEITRAQWRRYVETQAVGVRLPGIQGVGFARRLLPDEVERHVAAVRAEGFPAYSVWPAGTRTEYTSIVFLEPFAERNLRAFGYDMASDPVRRAAMEHARDSGAASLSGFVTLVQETGREIQHGVLLYLPVYRNGMPVRTTAERRAALLGWVYSPFRMNDLMQGVLGSAGRTEVAFEIHDVGDESAQTLKYSSRELGARPGRAAFHAAVGLALQAKRWDLRARSLPEFEAAIDDQASHAILVLGTIISLLLFGMLRHFARSQAALRAAEARKSAILRSAIDAVVSCDSEGRILEFNPAAEAMFGHRAAAVIGKDMADVIIPHEHRQAHRAGLIRRRSSGEASRVLGRRIEMNALRADGIEFPIELAVVQVMAGASAVHTGFIRDITPRRQAEEALKLASSRAIDEYRALLERVNTLEQAIGQATDLQSACRALLVFAEQSVPCNGLFVSLYEPDTGLRKCIFSGADGEETDVSGLQELPLNDTPNSRAIKTGKVIITDDFDAALGGAPRVDIGLDKDPRLPRSALTVPLKVMGRIIGAFEIQSVQPAAYRQEHIVVVEVAANVAAIVIDNLRLLARERELRRAAQASEAALRASEERFRVVVEQSGTGIYVIQDDRFVYANPRLCQMLGYELEELMMLRPDDLVDEQDRQLVEAQRRARERADRCAAGYSFDAHRKDGTLLRLGITSVRVMIDGKPAVMGMAQDITERSRLEAELRESESRFREAFETAPIGMALVGLDGRCLKANPALCELLGYSEEELMRMTFDEVTPPEDRTLDHVDKIRLLEGRISSYQMEKRRLHRDGHVLWTRLSVSIVRDNQGKPLHFVSQIEDIGARKAAEAADAASRAKSTFLATMSHEIRTPLNGVMGMLELLERTELDGGQRAMLEVVQESGASLRRIIDDILDFSRIEAGKLEIRPEPASLGRVVESVVNLFSASASGKGLQLGARIDPNIGASLLFDPVRVRQILSNLVGNAIKFTQAGSVEIRAEVCERDDDRESVRIMVVDSGIGISAEAQTRLFQPFEQGEGNTTRRFGGTGLGLAICRRLAEMMEGRLELSSEPGRGSTFTLRLSLPVAAAPANATVEAPARSARQGPNPAARDNEFSGPPAAVLVVDDHPINRLVITRQLESLGYKADTAENGAEGLSRWQAGAYVAILCDCNMPVMDGYELTRRIRALESAGNRSHTPIIACTANAMLGDVETCREAGMDDYVAKPVELAPLRRKLQQWTGAKPEARTFDGSVIASIACGGVATERELLDQFRASNEQDMALMESALAAGDLPQVASVAHRIKGASGSIGALAVSEACHMLERAARSGDRAKAALHAQTLLAQLARLDSFLEQPNLRYGT